MMPQIRPEDQPMNSRYDAEWTTWARRLAVVMLILGGLLVVYFIGPVLQILVFAFLLTFALFYPIRALTKRFGVRYAISVLIVFAVYLVIVIALLVNLSVAASSFLRPFSRTVQTSINQVIQQINDYKPGSIYLTNPFTGQRLFDLDFVFQPLQQLLQGENMSDLSQAAPDLLGTATSTLGWISCFV